MIISRLYNDILKKKEIWILFSKNHECQVKHIVTPSKDVNKLKMDCFYKDIKITFEESDAKPFTCEFELKVKCKINLEINQLTVFDMLPFCKQKSNDLKNQPFFKKYKIKSNDKKVYNSILNDDNLLNLINSSEFFGLYACTSVSCLKIRITSSYFVNSYEKLAEIYSIACRIIEHLIYQNC